MTKKNESDKENKKRFRPLVFFMSIMYIAFFLVITIPFVLVFGPYKNTRKAIINTILATRHAYWITDNISEKTINNLLGVKDTIAETKSDNEVKQDIDKINVKYTSGTEITQYNINTDRYTAYVLEIKNPCSIKVAMTKYLGKLGQKTSDMAEENNALAAINGGAFVDESSDGTIYAGTGATPGGFVISGGRVVYPTKNLDKDDVENVVAFTKSGKLIVGDHSLRELEDLDVQEAMCFRKPNIIINGERQVEDRMEEGLNPRTAVGQKEDGTVIFLVIDGRKLTAPGASLYDVQEIMMERGAVNAGALDGGYSSTMYYKGEVVNSPNAWNGERSVATAFYVK